MFKKVLAGSFFSLLLLTSMSVEMSFADVEMKLNNPGRALSWDGRISIRSNIYSGAQIWIAHVFKPGAITENSTPGYPDLSDPLLPFSSGVVFTKDGEQFDIHNPHMGNHAALSKDPRHEDSGQANPFRCSAGFEADVNGTSECYLMALYSAAVPNGNYQERRLQVQYARVRTEAFAGPGQTRLLHPQLLEAEFTSDIITLGTPDDDPYLNQQANDFDNPIDDPADDSYDENDNPDGNGAGSTGDSGDSGEGGDALPIIGWEISSTADGRFIFMDEQRYIFNFSQPINHQLWSAPKSIALLPYETATFKGLTFADHYPIARQPFRDAQGDPCGSCGVHYPWISQDGKDLFYTPLRIADEDGNEFFRGGYSLVGASTNYVTTHIDGPINRVRLRPIAFTTSPGETQTMWNPYPEFRTNFFPYRKNGPAYLIYSSHAHYDEVGIPEFRDGDYIVVQPMNELISDSNHSPAGDYQLLEDGTYRHVPGEKRVSHILTPDLSGNFNTGRLEQGAQFYTEYNLTRGITPLNANENNGFAEGRGILFPPGSFVRIPKNPNPEINPNAQTEGLNRSWPALTVELAVKPHQIGQPMNLFFHAHVLRMLITKKGKLMLRVKGKGGMRTVRTSIGVPLDASWTHLAVIFQPFHRKGSLFVNGQLKKQFRIPKKPIELGSATFVGPNNTDLVAGGPALMTIDEFAISKRARSHNYIYQRASRQKNLVDPRTATFVRPEQLEVSLPPSLNEAPLGLEKHRMRIPIEVADLINHGKYEDGVELGTMIFNDLDLTGKNIACASCHNASLAFTDGNSFSVGANGELTKRNTPTIFNRAYSTAQFFDGRSHSLVNQALHPIVDPAEMDGDIEEVLAYANSNLDFRPFIDSTFGEDLTEGTLATAIAAFVMSEMTGDTLIDQLNAGQVTGDALNTPLVQQAIRGKAIFEGKARCVTCHMGHNYTDEKFHNTGTFTSEDTGRSEITFAASDFGTFKTPTLRAINQTAPYFHDGSKATLEEVVAHYMSVPHEGDPSHDIEFRRLALSASEREDLLVYLRQLD